MVWTCGKNERVDGVKVAISKVASGNRRMTVEAARKIRKSGEPWYIRNLMSFTRPFLLGPLFFRTSLPCSGVYRLERGGMNLKRSQLLKIKGHVSSIWNKACLIDDSVCVI